MDLYDMYKVGEVSRTSANADENHNGTSRITSPDIISISRRLKDVKKRGGHSLGNDAGFLNDDEKIGKFCFWTHR